MRSFRFAILGAAAALALGTASAYAMHEGASGADPDSHGDAVASAAGTTCPHGSGGVHGACVSAIASTEGQENEDGAQAARVQACKAADKNEDTSDKSTEAADETRHIHEEPGDDGVRCVGRRGLPDGVYLEASADAAPVRVDDDRRGQEGKQQREGQVDQPRQPGYCAIVSGAGRDVEQADWDRDGNRIDEKHDKERDPALEVESRLWQLATTRAIVVDGQRKPAGEGDPAHDRDDEDEPLDDHLAEPGGILERPGEAVADARHGSESNVNQPGRRWPAWSSWTSAALPIHWLTWG